MSATEPIPVGRITMTVTFEFHHDSKVTVYTASADNSNPIEIMGTYHDVMAAGTELADEFRYQHVTAIAEGAT